MIYRADEHHLLVEMDAKQCQISQEQRTAMQPNLERLGKAVGEFPESHLWLTVVHHPRSNDYHARAKLKVPGQTIITGDRHETLTDAMQRCLEKVLRRVERYKANPDQEAVEQAQRRAGLATDIIAPVEPDSGVVGEAIVQNDYRAFREALLGQEESLRKRVGRWIQRYPEVQAEVGRSFEIADLVEEVFLLAFESYPDRPTHLSMREWLDSLVDPAVKAFWTDPEDREAVSFAQSMAQRPF